jgi:hypothetical protein
VVACSVKVDPAIVPDTGPLVRHAELVTSMVPVTDAPFCCRTNVMVPLPAGALVRVQVPVQVPMTEAAVEAAALKVATGAGAVVDPVAG